MSESTEGTKVIDCGNSLVISSAAEIHQQLRTAIDQSLSIELQAENVEKVDVAGLQVLVALHKEIEKTGGKVVWNKPSELLKKASLTLGLSQYIGLSC